MLDNFVHIKGEEHDCDVYVGEGYEHNFIVFRGTETGESVSWKDIWTNLKFSLAQVPDNRYQLHRGFFAAWQEVSPLVFASSHTLQAQQVWEDGKFKPFVITGHSLGAAMALLAAATFKPAECVTFGGPRVGGRFFVEEVEDACQLRRWVNAGDWCPRLPPPVLGYRHAGELHLLTRTGGYWVNPPRSLLVGEVIRDAFNRRERHDIEAYVERLEELIQR